jgi:hypothetical protein
VPYGFQKKLRRALHSAWSSNLPTEGIVTARAVDAPATPNGFFVADEMAGCTSNAITLVIHFVEILHDDEVADTALCAAEGGNADRFVDLDSILLDVFVFPCISAETEILLDATIRFDLHHRLDFIRLIGLLTNPSPNMVMVHPSRFHKATRDERYLP